MNTSPHPCGLWICGDNIAHDLAVNCGSSVALDFLNTWCGVSFAHDSYYGLTADGTVNPIITGNPAGIFAPSGTPHRFALYGFCPTISRFDVLDATGTGVHALNYPSYQLNDYYAGIQNSTVNLEEEPARTMWFGFSYMCVRDDTVGAPIDRFRLAESVFQWMDNVTKEDITGHDSPPAVYGMAQNFPNPFNPLTTIEYGMKEKGHVTLRIYNVAGQLSKVLVDGTKEAGFHRVTWDGKNERGFPMASGVYFCRMETKGFSSTKKLVLLR
jgi:hypothetical protein